MAVSCLMGGSAEVSAQGRLVAPRVASASFVFERWWFSSLLSVDSFILSGAEQQTVPFSFGFSPTRDWRIDFSGALSRGRVHVVDSETGAESVLKLDGPTDARVRVVKRLIDERVWLTVGADLPVGLTNLSSEEALAVRTLGAPALRMRTPALGGGLGVTTGAVYATPVGSWAVALGASFEMRSTYTPLDLTILGGDDVEVDLNPGEVVHVSLGLDRVVGQGRLSLLTSADWYGEDAVTVRSSESGSGTGSRYRLGPTYRLAAEYRARSLRAADVRLSVDGRYRSEFSTADGQAVVGSSGTVLDAVLSATFGSPRGLALVLGVAGAFDSGLEVDTSLPTAAMTSGTATVGLSVPMGSLSAQPFAQARVGKLDLGPQSLTARGLSLGLVLTSGAR